MTAAIGHWMSQPTTDGGLGLGATVTSLIFLTTILALVVYLTKKRPDRAYPTLIGFEVASGQSAASATTVASATA